MLVVFEASAMFPIVMHCAVKSVIGMCCIPSSLLVCAIFSLEVQQHLCSSNAVPGTCRDANIIVVVVIARKENVYKNDNN